MKRLQIWLLFALFTPLGLLGQAEIKVTQPGVSVNDNGENTPDPSAVLDVRSDNKGVVFPRLTLNQRDGIVNPVPGLLIYNIDECVYQYWNSQSWINVGDFQSSPAVPGNLTVVADDIQIAIQLNWQNGSPDAEIEIHRQEDGGSFTLLTTIAAASTSFDDTNVTYGSNYCYRIKYRCQSGLVEACATAPATALIFGDDLHAWFRADAWVDSDDATSNWTGRVKEMTDLSGNGRHLRQLVFVEMPENSVVRVPITGDAFLDGRSCFWFGEPGNFGRYTVDIGNWSGLSVQDHYYVVFVEYVSAGGNQRQLFGMNNVWIRAPNTSYKTNGWTEYYFGPHVDGGIWYTDVNTLGSSYYAVAATYRGGDSSAPHRFWKNGGEGVKGFSSGGTPDPSTAFSSIILGKSGDGANADRESRLFEIMFIKGNPEDHPQLFNDLHTMYLANRYPSLGITNPGL